MHSILLKGNLLGNLDSEGFTLSDGAKIAKKARGRNN
jgi:hypothetical protein